MNRPNLKNSLLLSLILLFVACSKEQDLTMTKTYKGVDPALWTYFENFEAEAKQRGLHIDLADAGITGSLEKIHSKGMVGLCNHRKDTPNHVIIDLNFWKTASENSKEMIIFHELGHCYLERGHIDTKKSDGTCASIMRSGKGACVDFYNGSNKEVYLDELYLDPLSE